MLWEKESTQDGALYTNMFTATSQELRNSLNQRIRWEINSKPTPQKSDEVSLQNRNHGNQIFQFRMFGPAMEMYNESLCTALPGSQNVSLAYGNRSACFLRLKMFAECLKDIELAKEAGFPEHLMPKLDQRKEDCLKHMRDGL